MSQFHIVHVIPDPRLHILNGYNDVIKTVIWGLRSHGNDVTYAVNAVQPGARNIVFGANMAASETLAALPDDTIIYNLEQVSGMMAIEPMRERLDLFLRKFTVWDYSEANIRGWTSLPIQGDVRYVPIGYAPIMTTIKKPEEQDIDVLIYGGPGESRLKAFSDLCLAGASAVFCFGLYDKARDDLIARSKLVLNISHSVASIFSIVRVSHLLANRKAVIADIRPGLSIEPDLVDAVQLAALDDFPEVCFRYLRDDAARAELEEMGHSIFKARDITTILAKALR